MSLPKWKYFRHTNSTQSDVNALQKPQMKLKIENYQDGNFKAVLFIKVGMYFLEVSILN